MTDDQIRELHRLLAAAGSIVVTSEPSPDGDGFGAEVALHHLIAAAFPGAGKRVVLLNENGCPDRFGLFEEARLVRALDDEMRAQVFDLAIVVDAGAERSGAVREVFERAPVRVCIDHHKVGSRLDYTLALVDPAASSTTSMIYEICRHPAFAVEIGRALGEALYLGAICDTGAFQYSLTRPATHRMAAHLLERGVRHDRIAEHVLLEQGWGDLKMLGRVIMDAQRSASGRVLHVVIDDPEMIGRPKTTFDRINTELAFVEDVDVSIVLRETPAGKTKVSLRSRGRVDVSELARALDAGGGGHARAAGCLMPGPAREQIERVVATAERFLDEADAAK